MASLMVNPDRLTALRQIIVKPGDRRQARAELDQFKQGIVRAMGLDYRRDLQPWLGDEITLAVTTRDLDRDLKNGQQPGYLVAMSTQDSQRSREFLQVFWQKRSIAGADLIFESYKGTQLIYGRDLQDPVTNAKSSKRSPQESTQISDRSVASAVIGNQFILFANSPKVLRDAINTVQATELGLASSAAYQTAIASLNRGRIGLVFLNLPQIAALTGETSLLAELPTKSTPTGTYESLAIGLGLDRQGLVAETALLTPSGQVALAPSRSQPIGALNYIPATSPFLTTGVNLDQFWSSLSQGVSGYGSVANWVNRPIEALHDRWQLDLPQDIFSWVKGDYALGLVPQRTENLKDEETAASGLADWVFVADKSADPTAQAAIDHLDAIAKTQGISVGSLQLADQTVNIWTRLSTAQDPKKRNSKALNVQAQVAGAHTSVGNYEIFTTSVEAMSEVLKANQTPIAKSQTFRQATAPLATPNNGYLYLNWETAQPLLERQFPILKVLKLAGQPFFEHLRSFALSSYSGQPGVQPASAFIQLTDD